MNVSWWMWTWCIILINILVGQLTDNSVVALLISLVEIIFTALVAANHTPKKYQGSNFANVCFSLICSLILLLPFGGLGMTVPLVNSITLPESMLRTLYLKRILIVPWLVIAYIVVVWLWSHYVHPWLRDQFANDSLHEFPLVTALITIALVAVGLITGDRGPDDLLATLYLFGGTLLIAFWSAWLMERLTALPLHAFSKRTSICLIVLGLVLNGAVMFRANQQAQDAAHYPTPIVISHRGVDHHNGVQNTTQALGRTAKEHPQKVETDIQETRDHQFVVMHDASLRKLANQKWRVEQRTKHQLAQTTIHEHGHQTKISTFDRYLALANHTHIPLIVEIKPQSLDPQAVSKQFIKTYRKAQNKDNFMMHSVDPQIIRKVHQIDPRIKTGLIQPFTLSRPSLDNLAFYSLNYHFVNESQINRLHAHGLKVFAWTVNSPATALRMKQLKINGVITDNYHEIRDIITVNDYPLTSRIKNLLFQLI